MVAMITQGPQGPGYAGSSRRKTAWYATYSLWFVHTHVAADHGRVELEPVVSSLSLIFLCFSFCFLESHAI
jgi:hypothetical protein